MYERGKIYKLVNDDGLIYIGSTCEPKLCIRLAKHRACYKYHLKGKGTYMTSYKLFENDYDPDIVLVQSYPCKSKDELHAKERYYIEKYECVNKVIPTRTREEWCDENKEMLQEKIKEYYQKYLRLKVENYIKKIKLN